MKKEDIVYTLKHLRDEIREAFEKFEPSAAFEQKNWNYSHKGGGEMSILRGAVFEKAAVNFSAVEGPNFPMQDGSGPFYATGISLITHMANPHVPTVHMNIRYIETANTWWLGGGYDLTPMGFPYEEDTLHFHQVAEKAAGKYYPSFKENAAKYFFIPHRQKERGQGGIFFDHFNTGDREADFNLWKQVGSTFLEGILPIISRRKDTPYSQKDKELQNQMRAHYVEFNLLYDRGTKFGFQSGGNPEAILCSMPPSAHW